MHLGTLEIPILSLGIIMGILPPTGAGFRNHRIHRISDFSSKRLGTFGEHSLGKVRVFQHLLNTGEIRSNPNHV